MRLPNSLFRLIGGLKNGFPTLFMFEVCNQFIPHKQCLVYGITEEGDSIKINVIDSYSDLRWKLRTDDKFRWDFKQYALNQDLSWYSSFYNRNLLYRYSPFYSSVDLYFDRFWYWDSWYWMDFCNPFRWNRYSWYIYHRNENMV